MLRGDLYEDKSAALLKSHGLRVVDRGYRCRRGEIDLIATDGTTLVFVEVRARRHSAYGGAVASVDRKKQCKISRCAAVFLSRHPEWRHAPCRFDVIAWGPAPGTNSMQPRWIRAAFTA